MYNNRKHMKNLKIEVDIVNNTGIPNATTTDIIIKMIIAAASVATELLLPLLLPLMKKNNRGNPRPKLCPAFGHCPRLNDLFFSKICFIKRRVNIL